MLKTRSILPPLGLGRLRDVPSRSPARRPNAVSRAVRSLGWQRLDSQRRQRHLQFAVSAAPGLGAIIVVVLLALSSGCDRTDELAQQAKSPISSQEESGQRSVRTNLSPRGVLEACVQAYQQLESYEDRGFVRLTYAVDGDPMVDRAPLSVAWDQQGRLGLKVYSVVAGPTDGRFRLRIDSSEDGSPDGLARQVVSRSVPEVVGLDWLLQDSIVGDRIAAGLAGFPPQLDLLLSESPMLGLIEAAVDMSFLPTQGIDQRACYGIQVEHREGEYRVWVDQSSLLVRRIEMPHASLDPRMLEDERISQVELTVELEDVRTNHRIDWETYAVASRPGERLVRYFVSPPEQHETRGLGEQIPAFRMSAADGSKAYRTSSDASRESHSASNQPQATVLLWLADHPACRVAAEQLAAVAETMAKAGFEPGQIEYVPIWAEPNPPSGLSFSELEKSWELPATLALDRQAVGRDLFQVVEAPTWVVLDANHRLQLRESRTGSAFHRLLPKLLQRIANGDDLAKETRARSEAAENRYRAELTIAAAIDDESDTTPAALPSYPPLRFQVEPRGETPHSQAVVAATVDPSGQLWRLHGDGKLLADEGLDEPKRTLSIEPWEGDQSPMRLVVSPDLNHVAVLSKQDSRLCLIEVASERNIRLNLGDRAGIIDARWLPVRGSNHMRLAVVTSDSRVALIDPSNREQMSGRSRVAPVAVLPTSSPASSLHGEVVLADGTFEPLQPADDATPSLFQPIGHDRDSPVSTPSSGESSRRQVRIHPAAGLWGCSEPTSGEVELIVAHGWLAKDEPAIFALDAELNPGWHHAIPRMPQDRAAGERTTASQLVRDPQSGQRVWVITRGKTIFLFREDGRGNDHFRVDDEIVGAGLVASGTQLNLILVHPHRSRLYRIIWMQ